MKDKKRSIIIIGIIWGCGLFIFGLYSTSTGVMAQGSCEPIKTYAGVANPGQDCSPGRTGVITLTACLPDGCALKGAVVDYQKKLSSCGGRSNAVCSAVCQGTTETGRLTISAGQQCASVTASCNVPDSCGSCTIDINNYGLRKWENIGCSGSLPTVTPTPSGFGGILQPTVKPTVTPAVLGSEMAKCLNLQTDIASGSAPLKVRFTAQTQGQIDKYRFYFVDGTSLAEIRSSWVDHTYKKIGTFTPYVEVLGVDGKWQTSPECRTTMTIGTKQNLPSTGFSPLYLFGIVGLAILLRKIAVARA